jgi:hypothetical protein
MICRCYIIEVENNKWLIAFSECVEAHSSFGPFHSFWEAESYHMEYLSKYSLKPLKIDFEHPERAEILRSIKGPPFKLKYWDFEDYKVMAWRNAGFRSRR